MKKIVWALALGVFVFGCKGAEDAKSDAPAGDVAPPVANADDKTGGSSEAVAASYGGVQALLTAKCMPCHGENGKDGIDLRSYESVMKGGSHGPIVVAGDAAGSQLVHALRGQNGVKQMPFNQTPLVEEDIKKIEDWINAGAKSE